MVVKLKNSCQNGSVLYYSVTDLTNETFKDKHIFALQCFVLNHVTCHVFLQ